MATNHPVHRIGETNVPLDDYLDRLYRATPGLSHLPRDPRRVMCFPTERHNWVADHPTIVDGRRGQTLYLCGFQMVQEWEAPLLTKMGTTVTHDNARILEIGYGLGISATSVQAAHPSLHVIIEANVDIANSARPIREGNRGWESSSD